ncbi:MAG TPA: hypothetical protein VE981_10645 [Planctomycetota bacterium]|nr:hypothetical protein [Planctomycetota bacterium]
MLRLLSTTVLLLCLPAAVAMADHGKGAVGGKTISPRTLHEEDASVETGFRYQRSETFSDDRLLAGAAEGHDIHSVDWLAEFSISGSYGITDHLTISLSLPFEVIHGFRFVEDDGVNPPAVNGANSIVGMGDATFLGKFSFSTDPVELAVLAGVKIPTGSTSQLDNGGNPLEPDHQPGTGSWDPIIGVAALHQFESYTLGGSILYRYTIEGRHEFRPGQQLTVAAKAEYQIAGLGKFPRVYVSIELAEQFTAMDRSDDVRNHDTGGSILTLGPGVRIRVNDHVTFATAVAIPIYQGLYGEQHHERFEFLFGTAVDF